MNEHSQRTNAEITAIYRRHVDTVYRVSYMFLRNVPDTEDAVQSVFMKLIQRGPRFADDEHEKAWLIVTTQNHCKNMLNYWWKRKRSPVSQLADHSPTALDRPGGELLELLLEQPDRYKIVLYLFYFEGYATKEIAKLLGRKDSTVRTQLSKGRKRLKGHLTGGKTHGGRTTESCN
ncbi:sigma-70 family RNA polymerase sigma factor [Paenibacillaceae bacterium]|nr:sigma-70 family RNA polymerase sigma factor [Paenibacillaceae bacterium]